MVLTANDDYFRGAPKLGGVEVRYMADPNTRELGLQAGELDLAAGINEAQWVDRINAEGNLIADIFGVAEAVWINLNVTAEPLDDPLVREAIALAVNRDEHAALRGAPVSELIASVVPAQLMPGGLTEEEAAAAGVLHEQDIERARELMAEAGYADGFSIDLITSEMTDYSANYEVLQAELAEIGITVNLTVVDHATMHEQIRKDVEPDCDLRRLPAERRRLSDQLLPLQFHRRRGRLADHQLLPLLRSRRSDRAGTRRNRSRGARRALEAGEYPDPEGFGRLRSTCRIWFTLGRLASTTDTSWCPVSPSIRRSLS